jgi:RND family efflux transporter MFP subunit
MLRDLSTRLLPLTIVMGLAACAKQPAGPAGPAFQAMPVQTQTVNSSPVPRSDEYVATIKSRRSATMSPQVDGYLTRILAHSGDHVLAGQLLMEIDPIKQEATVASQLATEKQKLALYEYNQTEVERQRKLFEAGVTSRDTLDQAEQAFKNSKADYESAAASRVTQERQLSYYKITAPFDGIVGDIPVHVGDYASATTLLTTVDENGDLEAYIYIPAEHTSDVRRGLGVDILDNRGNLLQHATIDFVSPQIDNQLQGILAKAKVNRTSDVVRNAQLVKARVIWSVNPTPTVPVLAVTRIGGQTFVYLADTQGSSSVARQRAVDLGDTVGNNYAVRSGLKPGDKVIISGIQFLVDGAPVKPLG